MSSLAVSVIISEMGMFVLFNDGWGFGFLLFGDGSVDVFADFL